MNDFLVIGDLCYAHRIRINNYCDIRVEVSVMKVLSPFLDRDNLTGNGLRLS